MSSEAEGLLTSETEDTPERMNLTVAIKNVGPCRKHVAVTVSETDIAAIRETCLEELSEKAQVPGFRVGKVPRQLMQRRFKDEIAAQIKQKVLLASLEQLSEDNRIDPINEPRIDVESLEIPDAGEFHYEFEVEVRPEFDLPEYSSFTIRRPTGEISDAEFAAYREQFLSSYSALETVAEAAQPGDHVNCSIEFTHQGAVIRKLDSANIRLVDKLNFQDAVLEGCDRILAGVTAGETRTATVKISMQSPVVEMRGEDVTLTFEVSEVQRRALNIIDKEFLDKINCESEEALETELRSSLERQVEFQRRQATRQQVLEKIGESADWDLPESLVRQQTENALRRELLEMSQAGFTKEQILARENEIRRNAIDNTRQALKEHFVLDRIATEQKIECDEEDITRELVTMSFQSGEPVRRIRARLAKSGMIENLEAQLRERKAVDFILSKATFQDVPREPMARNDSVGLRFAICGNMSASLIDDSDSDAVDSE